MRKQFKVTMNETESKSSDLDSALVLRAIERLKASGNEVSPTTLAMMLNVSRSEIYDDLDLLDLIYRNLDELSGHDKLITNLFEQLKRSKKEIFDLNKKLENIDTDLSKIYSDGFAKGASLKFRSANNAINIKEIWARGVLQLDMHEDLDEAKIKKAYRQLASILHPDSSGKDSAELMNRLTEALQILTK